MAVVVTVWVAVREAAGVVGRNVMIEVCGGRVVVVTGIACDGPLATVTAGTKGGFASQAGGC